ncbi:MAG: hypothetical protein F4Z04_11120 [Acidobacteria bacterium]|nr:hypothetical protein [Acidobacteriota bacterium]
MADDLTRGDDGPDAPAEPAAAPETASDGTPDRPDAPDAAPATADATDAGPATTASEETVAADAMSAAAEEPDAPVATSTESDASAEANAGEAGRAWPGALLHRWRSVKHGVRRRSEWAVIAVVALVAGGLVSAVTVDLGPSLRARAEQQFANAIDRPVTIGRLSTYLLPGRFLIEDLVIGGQNPGERDFFTADSLVITTQWLPLLQGEVLVDSVDLQGWQMLVEGFEGGRHTFPAFVARSDSDEASPPDAPAIPDEAAEQESARRIVTTVQYLRAHDGAFIYEDHGAPWSIVAPNIDMTLAKTTGYGGRAAFSEGTLVIGDYEPMTIAMDADYRLDGGLVELIRADFFADGFEARVDGTVDMLNWPEQLYHVRDSAIDLPIMKTIFFARDNFTVTGDAAFTGTWHIFDGGRELTGTFTAPDPNLNDLAFPDLDGDLIWTRDRFEITRAQSSFYDGDLDFTYAMKPLGAPEPGVATFLPRVTGASLDPLLEALEVEGVRPLGRLDGEARLEWPLGAIAERYGDATVRIEPPEGVALLPGGIRPSSQGVGWAYATQRFEPDGAPWRFPMGGEASFTFAPEDGVLVEPGWMATPLTAIRFDAGRIDEPETTRIPFEVMSADWQESDRVLAAMLTAFDRPTGELELAGYGSMNGLLLGDIGSPRVEATFDGDGIHAWNVDWGHGEGDFVLEDNILDVTAGRFDDGAAVLAIDGAFAIGPPPPGSEELDVRFELEGLPTERVRAAFELEGYAIDAPAYGQIRLYGPYGEPFGFGRLSLAEGMAYGEPFDDAEADLRFDGTGVWLDGLTVRQGDGDVTGAMYVRWDATYSVNADARNLDLSVSNFLGGFGLPVDGRLDAAISGAGPFDDPSYALRGTMSDVAIDGAPLGQVSGRIGVEANAMAVELEAASADVAVSGAGRIGFEGASSELRFNVTNTRLDPFVRARYPDLLPGAALLASGTLLVEGPLDDMGELDVDVSVDEMALGLFDYTVRNDGPVRLSLSDNVIRVDQMRLGGEGTELDVTGSMSLADEQVALAIEGDASFGILQGFLSDVRSRGAMRLTAQVGGSFDQPVVNGEARITDGRLRHLALPHALDALNGRVVLEPGGVRFDELTAELGGGPITFGGRVGLDGYGIGDLNVTASGRNIALRYPEGIRSEVDGELTLTGTVDAPTLGGVVTVQDAVWLDLFQSDAGFFETSDAALGPDDGTESLPLRFDLRIEAPSSLRFADNQAQIVASADLTLTGTYDRPSLLGNAEIERGQIYFEGNRYRITRGIIGFANPVEVEPIFDIEAETDIRVPGQTYRVTLGLNGTFDRLEQPTLESDPPLQQFEIIGLLLGDRRDPQQAEIRTLRSPEASQQERLLQAAGAGLLNNPLAAGVGGVVERSLGIDNFEITPALDDPAALQSTQLVPTARVRIGKRISDRAYLTFSRAVSGTNQDLIVMLEYDASDRLSWVLSQNEDRTYALDVRVRHAF